MKTGNEGFIFKLTHLQIFKFFFIVCLTSCILSFLSCSNPVGEHHPEWKQYFDAENITGCIEIYDLKNSKFIDYNPDRCGQRFIPASTFKICNSLIALETKTIPDTSYVIHWDSVERNVSSWNHDQTLTEAFHNSCVPCYQQIARKIGMDNYKNYLNRLHYGNMLTGNAVDSFWLNGDLRISCDEQIEFLKDLYTYQLQLSKRTIDLVKGMMIQEKNPDYTLSGKTGWGIMDNEDASGAIHGKKNIGWFVGYVEKKDDVYFFAMNIESPDPALQNWTAARIDITKDCLKDLKILPQ